MLLEHAIASQPCLAVLVAGLSTSAKSYYISYQSHFSSCTTADFRFSSIFSYTYK